MHINKLTLLALLFGGIALATLLRYAVTPTSFRALLPLEAVDQGLTPFMSYERGTVVAIADDQSRTLPDGSAYVEQNARVRLESGAQKGSEIAASFTSSPGSTGPAKLAPGDSVVVASLQGEVGVEYVIADRYRLPTLYLILIVFVLLALLFAGWRGVTAVVGLGFSFFVLVMFVAPYILLGKNPVAVALFGAVTIATVSLYLAHGLKPRTTIAVLSTLVTLLIACGLSYFAGFLLQLSGLGSENAYFLQQGYFASINLKGVLLAGIIIGTLGVLDDITTAQSAVVDELAQANPMLGLRGLYARAMSVGKEHITSLINTLVLVYAGASLPLFLILIALGNQPLWLIVNSETFMEELVRTLVGSIALILAVPITTLLAAYYFSRKQKEKPPQSEPIKIA